MSCRKIFIYFNGVITLFFNSKIHIRHTECFVCFNACEETIFKVSQIYFWIYYQTFRENTCYNFQQSSASVAFLSAGVSSAVRGDKCIILSFNSC